MRKECKTEFLLDQFSDLSIQAAFAWGYVYQDGLKISDKEKNELRGTIKELLNQFSEEYKKEVLSHVHTENIQKLADEITNAYKSILKDGRFRIGTAQKAFNLYLKYLWCIGLANPPHCPFDSVIYEKLKKEDAKSMDGIPVWTKLIEKEHYKKLVENAKRVKLSDESLSQWECRIWSEWKQKNSKKMKPICNNYAFIDIQD